MFLSNIYRYLFPLSEYARLKEKYAAKIISNWQESSDPEKSVHEDLGIAAYLSCLWQGKHTSFVDLGCGNGLLDVVLNFEARLGRRRLGGLALLVAEVGRPADHD